MRFSCTLFSKGMGRGESVEVDDFAQFAAYLPQLITVGDLDVNMWRGFTSADLSALKTEKASGNAISITEFQDGRRHSETHIATYAVGLDFDKKTDRSTVGQITRALAALKWNYVVLSSWSHTLETPRLRVFVELSRGVAASEYYHVYDHVVSQLKAKGVEAHPDESCRDSVRLFFIHLPNCLAKKEMLETHYLTEVRAAPVDVEAALAAAPKPSEQTKHTPAFTFNTRATGQDVYKLAMEIRDTKKKQHKVSDAEAFKRVCHAFKKNIEHGGTIPAKVDEIAKGVLHPHSQERDNAVDRPTHTQLFAMALSLFSKDDTLDINAVRDFFTPSIKWTFRYAELQPGYDKPKLDDAKVQEELSRAKDKAEAYREEEENAQIEKDEQDPELKRMRAIARGDGQDGMYTAKERVDIAKACGVKPDDLDDYAVIEGAGRLFVASLEGYKMVCPKTDPMAGLRLQTELSPLRSWGTLPDPGVVQSIMAKHGLHKAEHVEWTYVLDNSHGRLRRVSGVLHLDLLAGQRLAVEPAFNEDVDALLDAISDNGKELRLQLAAAWCLDLPWPALLHYGEGGTGKTTLVEALSLPWDGRRLDFLDYAEGNRFAASKLRTTPIVDFPEGAGSRGYSFGKLKRLITEFIHSTEDKNLMPVPLRGYLRVCVNVNDLDAIYGHISMLGENDEAIARRFVTHKVNDPDTCRILLDKLGSRGHDFRLATIAQHIAWLNQEIGQEARAWVRSYKGDKVRTRRAMVEGDGRFHQCYDLLIHYITTPAARPQRGSEQLWVRESDNKGNSEIILTVEDLKVVRHYASANDVSAARLSVNERQLGGLLKQLSKSGSRSVLDDPRKEKRSTSCYVLDMDRFWEYCENNGSDVDTLKRKLEELQHSRKSTRNTARSTDASGAVAQRN